MTDPQKISTDIFGQRNKTEKMRNDVEDRNGSICVRSSTNAGK